MPEQPIRAVEAEGDFAVSMTGVSMRFGTVQALDKVDLHVKRGTVHALVGENGAGKTTLMRILYGALQADEGEVRLDGKPVQFRTSKQAIESGIGMVSQHYGIIPDMTCLQNLMLGAEGGPILDPKAESRAEELARRMGFQFNWRRKAESLSPGGAQKLEILKLLWRNARIMILDEPTAMLSPSDGDALFASLKKLAGQGATVILVTHRLPEVLDHCSTVTVLRGGLRVAEKTVKETNGRELAQLIVGGSIAEPPALTAEVGASVLHVQDLTVSGERGHDALRSVSVRVGSGEIVGIAGVDGSGQRELFQAIAGLIRPRAGQIAIAGFDAQTASSRQRIALGLRIIPEDRHEEGLIEDWSLEENAALSLQRLSPFARGLAVDVKGREAAAAAIAERFDTKHGGLKLPVRSLSGGNQQRFVAARALFLSPKAILAFQPARGLDLNSTTRVYEGIREACKGGAGALVVSFDLDELLEYCDRIVVMNRGEMFHPDPDHARDRDQIGRLMVSAS
ncbi:MAG TPA: ABC transporter ATP-binding protein [Fimbriimonadaceae bacterium]|nr:ABC transporter ATP-binding protein [Fimbriimonadaceae bacterium]